MADSVLLALSVGGLVGEGRVEREGLALPTELLEGRSVVKVGQAEGEGRRDAIEVAVKDGEGYTGMAH